MKIFTTTLWYLYAVLATILTLGAFIRFHLVTVRIAKNGGKRAGGLGGKHVYQETTGTNDTEYVTVSTWSGKNRMPVRQLGHTETRLATVTIVFKGKRKAYELWAWGAGSVAEYVNNVITDIDLSVGQA